MKYPQLVSMPSDISDWLEEQLEARGIDAVVYTRYVLSLLHRDPVDVVCPDQDLHFIQPHKEVRRSGSGRKHFRYFTGWRNHLQADAEKLKRSAAIECLMSASDQNCGIETLVDELCAKLKGNKNAPVITESASTTSSTDPQTISPQDLVQKYYAAFPPLIKHHRSPGTPASIVTLIPKWFSSPKKKSARRQNRSASFEDKLHYKVETDIMKPRFCGKQKLGYFSRSRNDLGYSRSMAKSVERSESMTDWDLLMFSNKNNSFPDNDSNMFANIVEEKVNNSEKQNRVLWSDEESMNICDDLPVDILDLLDSPGPQGYTVEMMNLANMRDGGNKNFIQCGTNITSSIWSVDAVVDDSVFDNNYNTAVDSDQSGALLGMKFKSLTVGNKSIEHIWSNNSDVAQNETNLLFENYRKSSLFPENSFNSLSTLAYATGLEKFEKWSEAEYFDSEAHLSTVTRSLIKLNHAKEDSSFTEVIPKAGIQFCNKLSNPLPILQNTTNANQSVTAEKDDLLTSTRSHFRPINAVKGVNEYKNQSEYPDGTSFVISADLEHPKYVRSNSGSQYLAIEKSSPKKLMDYKIKNGTLTNSALVLKFFVKQNDKACQTDDMIMDYEMDNSEVPCKKRVVSDSEEFYFPGDEDEANLFKCTCSKSSNKEYESETIFSFGDDLITCKVHVVRPDSMLAEMWKGNSKKCDGCNKNTISWSNTYATESIWHLDKESLESIWNGGEVCQTCLNLNGGPLPRDSQLREDISQDGEQLLSDLSTLQKSYYMELPAAEISYDISEMLTGNKERKRRHSPIFETAKNAIPVHRGSWNITSLMQVTSVPVLHSVTL